MAKVFKRICIETYTITDGDRSFTLTCGTEYLTGGDRADDTVRVFSTYWCDVPARIFAGAIPGP